MADGGDWCQSASSARDIWPAVVCSVIVAPSPAVADRPGVMVITVRPRLAASRPVRGSPVVLAQRPLCHERDRLQSWSVTSLCVTAHPGLPLACSATAGAATGG